MSNKEDGILVKAIIVSLDGFLKAKARLISEETGKPLEDPNNPDFGLIGAYVSGKMRQNYIKLEIGDEVLLELSPYDISNGRIVQRTTKQDNKSSGYFGKSKNIKPKNKK